MIFGGKLLNFALNHMTAPNASFEELLGIAQSSGCCGVELRNDLSQALFSGAEPKAAKNAAAERGLRLLALAEVKSFNHLTNQTLTDTHKLAELSKACGAEAIVFIPANDGSRTDEPTRKKDLYQALQKLIPVLESYELAGFVEPLGFNTSSVRLKREVIEAIEAIGATDRIKIVHDTFHHSLADEKEIYAQHTGMVHISGVDASDVAVDQMQDEHRVLVGSNDRLQNIQQLKALAAGGYDGPVSMEAFAGSVHNLVNIADPLRDSFQFINSGLAAKVA